MRTGRWLGVVGAVVLAAEVLLVGASVALRSPAPLVLGQVVLLPTAGLAALAARHLTVRDRQRREEAEWRSQAERRRVADAVHDLVGHDLSLIAMQVGVLELANDAATAELAGRIRQSVQGAVITLHETTQLISEGATVEPATDDLERIIDEHRRAGADLTVTGALPALDAPSRVLLASAVREGLTNAARHARGRPVRVTFTSVTAGHARVEILTRCAAPPPVPAPRQGGLAALARRLEALGGALMVSVDDDGHRVVAEVGPWPRRLPDQPPRHSHARRLVREVAAPLAGAVVVVLTFYSWACFGATIEPAEQARVRVGMTTGELARLLPRHEARVRLLRAPQAPRAWDCRQFTDGNFPVGMATLEVCTDGSTVVRVSDLTRRPLW